MNHLLGLIVAFFRVGVFGYGGGPGFIGLIQSEAVNRYHWLTVEEFADGLAVGNALPGPIGTKMAIYVGYKVAGLLGAFTALVALILPSTIAVLVLAKLVYVFKGNPKVAAMLKGVRPVVVALILVASLDMVPKSMTTPITWVIAIAAFAALYFLRLHPAMVVAAGLAAGLLLLA